MNARDTASEAADCARDSLRKVAEEIPERAKALNKVVHENPWAAIAAVGLIAFLLGMLVRRR